MLISNNKHETAYWVEKLLLLNVWHPICQNGILGKFLVSDRIKTVVLFSLPFLVQ